MVALLGKHQAPPLPRIIEKIRLNRGLNRKLTLISAPAGYGKTTIAAAWLQDCSRPAAWLSLDENDNDLILFLSYLIAAIRTIFPQACHDTGELLRAPQAPLTDYLATLLINEIEELPEPFILALDDFHLIHADAVQRLTTQMIKAQCPRVAPGKTPKIERT